MGNVSGFCLGHITLSGSPTTEKMYQVRLRHRNILKEQKQRHMVAWACRFSTALYKINANLYDTAFTITGREHDIAISCTLALHTIRNLGSSWELLVQEI